MDQFELAQLRRASGALKLIDDQRSQDSPAFSIARLLRNEIDRPLKRDDDFEMKVSRKLSDEFFQSDLTGTPDFSRFIPFSAFATRALQSGSPGSQGAYAAGTTTWQPLDVFRPWSMSLQAGITTIAGLRENIVIPRTLTRSSAVWQGVQNANVAAADAALGSLSLQPRTVIGVVDLSVQLLRQANAQEYVTNELLRTLGTAIDQAVLSGTGGGMPLGIIATPGVQTQAGASLSQAGVTSMLQKVSEANAVDENISYISTPAIRQLLQNREAVATSGQYILKNDRVADRAAYVTTDCPTATMVCGDFSDVLLGMWGPGLQIDISQGGTGRFNLGLVSVRVMAFCDVAVLHPTSFCIASSIT